MIANSFKSSGIEDRNRSEAPSEVRYPAASGLCNNALNCNPTSSTPRSSLIRS